MKITVYTITDCEFSKQEKEYLASHNLQFEEKNLETNREFLTEMLTVSNNFAGTPVTKVEKDDGQIAVLKGFTKEEFDQALGFTQTQASGSTTTPNDNPTNPSTPVPGQPTTPSQTPQDNPTPIPPEPPMTPNPTPPPVQDPVQPPTAPAPPTPPTPSQETPPKPPADQQLNSILNDLQAKVNEEIPAAQPPQNPAPSNNLPNIPEPNFGTQH